VVKTKGLITMDLNRINLNLLVVLDAIIEEKNISLAAKRLNLTQPAVSHMLKHLRTILDDDLILRGPFNKMILTKKAQDMKMPVRKVLNDISGIFTETKYFDPEYDKFTFTMGMPDIASVLLIPKLNTAIGNFSGNVKIKIKNILDITSYEDMIHDNLDLAIGNFSISSQNIMSESLFSTELVCVADKSHEVFKSKKLTLDKFLEFPHLQLVYREEFQTSYDEIIGKATECSRKILITIPNIMTALHSLKNSNSLCIAHKNIAEKFSTLLDLNYRDLPFNTPIMNYYLYWKREDNASKPFTWMKKLIMDSFSSHR